MVELLGKFLASFSRHTYYITIIANQLHEIKSRATDEIKVYGIFVKLDGGRQLDTIEWPV